MVAQPQTPLALSTVVNGHARIQLIDPRMLLVEYLRDVLGLTGAHVGCDTSQCGACTVLLDDQPVKSCSVLAMRADGRRVTTIEGLANGDELHPVQRAFWENFGLQCGYCTPGFIMTTVALLSAKVPLDDASVRERLSGNLCRCTGYVGIRAAVRAAAAVG